jgi:hypothetical protein
MKRDEMGGLGMHAQFLSENLEGKGHLGAFYVDTRILFKLIL